MKYCQHTVAVSCLAIIASGCAYKPSKPDKMLPKQAPYLVDLLQYKSPNLRKNGQSSKVAIAVAFSGGGSRAANLATGVLLGMEKMTLQGKPNLLREIDYFSTVSGGGLAAGLYVESVKRHIDATGDTSLNTFDYNVTFDKPRSNCNGDGAPLRRHLERGYHGNILGGLLSVRTWFGNFDRGDALESELDDTILGGECREQTQSLKLGDFFVPIKLVPDKPERLPQLPMWVANATVYQNGWAFPFAPNVIVQHEVTSYSHRLKSFGKSGGIEIVDGYEIPAAVGLKASASFPLAIPATTLGSRACDSISGSENNNRCYLQLMDGGLSDNTGVITALQLLAKEQSPDVERKLLIVVDAYPGDLTPHSRSAGSPKLLQVLKRVTEINKDAFRQLLRHQLSDLIRIGGGQIQVIYLTIDDSQLLRDVGTNFNVTKEQQNALIECGRKFITERQSDIDQWSTQAVTSANNPIIVADKPASCTV